MDDIYKIVDDLILVMLLKQEKDSIKGGVVITFHDMISTSGVAQ